MAGAGCGKKVDGFPNEPSPCHFHLANIETMKKLLIFPLLLFSSTHLASAEPTHEKKEILGRSYMCDFGKYGVVTIDTRDPGSSITIGGVRHPAKNGGYFYQTDDGKFAIAFNPKMTAWTYLSGDDPDGITDSHCKVSTNKKYISRDDALIPYMASSIRKVFLTS
ncbi:hypothetical protein EMIT0158MI4_130095 [Burkholderia ambifaria]